jgi:hypothetical protein
MGDTPIPGHTNDQLSTIFADFLAANPLSKIKRQAFEVDGPKQAIIEKPWGDSSLAVMIPDDPTALADILNSLRLPLRFSALWHQDTKDLEIIWTAYPLGPDSQEIGRRTFKFKFRASEYVCEFGASSARLKTLAGSLRQIGQSETGFRNTPSYKREDAVGHSFWIRNIEYDEDQLLEFVPCLNFYMTYYDSKSPHILIHSPPKGSTNFKPQSRYVREKFPKNIVAKEIDPNITHFWEASRTGDPSQRFLYHYRIIEYLAMTYLETSARSALRRVLATPHFMDSTDESIEQILIALQKSRMDDYARIEAMIRETVEVDLLWGAIHRNSDSFSRETTFDGGFVLSTMVSSNTKLEQFRPGGITMFCGKIREIRNALSHGKDQKTAGVIAPTKHNFSLLEPWNYLISIATGELILYNSAV